MSDTPPHSHTDSPLVTAVVTTYKRPDTAKRAVQSVLAQTYRPLEILVVEDGGSSDLAEWCRDTAPGKILYIRHERNKGLAAARNTGMKMAKADYVAYLDDDDEWKPERIEKQMGIVARMTPDELNKLGVVSCGVEMRFPEKSRVSIRGHGTTGNLKKAIIENGLATPSSTFLFSRSALIRVGGFDEMLSSSIDHDIWMSLAANGFYGYAVNESLVVIYDYSGRATMMGDISSRIKGVKEYLDKWRHVHSEWFGIQKSHEYDQRYFTCVISKLAAEKLWSGDYKNARKAVREIFKYSHSYMFNMSSLLGRITFVGAQRNLPTPIINAFKATRRLRDKFLSARS